MHPDVASYSKALAPDCTNIGDLLAREIDLASTEAEGRILHGPPLDSRLKSNSQAKVPGTTLATHACSPRPMSAILPLNHDAAYRNTE